MQSKSKTSVVSCDNELFHYVKMIDFFQNQMKDPEKAEVWKNKALIRLMDLIDLMGDSKHDGFVQNGLILLMAISDDNPADIYSSRGIDTAQLSPEEKREFISLMKTEVLLN